MSEADAALIATTAAYFAAWMAGDIAAMAGFLTADSVYMPNGGATMRGRETLAAYYQNFVDTYDVGLIEAPEIVESHGDQGLVIGLYTIRLGPKAGGDTVERSGRYVMWFVKESDGVWRMSREVTQTSADTDGWTNRADLAIPVRRHNWD